MVAGDFPPGSSAEIERDYARLRLLGLLAEQDVPASVANDFTSVERWLPVIQLLITYVACRGKKTPVGQGAVERNSEQSTPMPS